MGRKNYRKRERVPRISNNLLVHPKRMEIWYASLPMDRRTSVQGGSRPVVIVSNDICNEKSPAVTVIPITRQIKHLDMPTHVILEEILNQPSMALAEQIMTVDKRFLNRKIGSCKSIEPAIEKAMLEQLNIKEPR